MYNAEREEIQLDDQDAVYSVSEESAGRLDEPQSSQPDITPDDITADTRRSLIMRKFMAADAEAEEARADWDRRANVYLGTLTSPASPFTPI